MIPRSGSATRSSTRRRCRLDHRRANYVHLADISNSNSDDSFTPGQKQDTTCPDITGHKNSPKDDFTDVASFNEQAANGDVYLYGATLRYAANGNASENIELKQGTSGFCAGSTTLLARTPGDKLLAIDYLGGGSRPQFHLLTWVASGACNVGNDTAPCWGATVATLTPAVAEGGVSVTNFTAAQNPISGVPIVAGQFAEFGVSLAAAGFSRTRSAPVRQTVSSPGRREQLRLLDQDVTIRTAVAAAAA
jgi:hypothetical protein